MRWGLCFPPCLSFSALPHHHLWMSASDISLPKWWLLIDPTEHHQQSKQKEKGRLPRKFKRLGTSSEERCTAHHLAHPQGPTSREAGSVLGNERANQGSPFPCGIPDLGLQSFLWVSLCWFVQTSAAFAMVMPIGFAYQTLLLWETSEPSDLPVLPPNDHSHL